MCCSKSSCVVAFTAALQLILTLVSSAREFPGPDEAMADYVLIKCKLNPLLFSTENVQNRNWHSTHLNNSNFRFNGSENWCKLYLESLIARHVADRRQLIDEHSFQMSSPASAPAPIPTSTTAPGPPPVSRLSPYHPPEHAFASAPTPMTVKEPPTHSVAPSRKLSPVGSPLPAYRPSAEAPVSSSSLPPKSSNSGSSVAPGGVAAPPSGGTKSIGARLMSVAVILAGATSFFLSGVLFCCYSINKRRRNKTGSGICHRDERQVEGFPKKSFDLESNISEEGKGKLSFETKSIQDDAHVSSSDVNSGDSHAFVGVTEEKSTPLTLDVKPPVQAANPSSPPPLLPPSPPPPPPPPPPSPPPPPPPSPPPPPPLPLSMQPCLPPRPSVMPPPIKKANSTVPGPPPPPPKPSPLPPPLLKASGFRPLPNNSLYASNGEENVPKSKLKPLFWEKVPTNADKSMVWHRIGDGSFRLDEETVENLFGYRSSENHKSEVKKGSSFIDASTTQLVRILDPKKSQNLAIMLRALNVSGEEVHDALVEGSKLSNELLQALLRMAPTSEEELKLRLYSDDISHLGTAERFFKKLLDIPSACKRLNMLLLMGTLEEDISAIKQSLRTLEIACKELRNNRLFLKLLEAVLKTGNRMNNGTFRGGAQAFKLDTLLKLEDVKGIDGKTTLLHFVVQEIIRSEGMQAVKLAKQINGSTSTVEQLDDHSADSPTEYGDDFHGIGLKIVSSLSNELEEVKKAAVLDIDDLTDMVKNHGDCLIKAKEFLDKDLTGEDSGFYQSLKCFIEHAEIDVISLLEGEKKIRALVKNTTEYFHGNSAKREGLCLFVIVRDFLGMVDKVCAEIRQAPKRGTKTT